MRQRVADYIAEMLVKNGITQNFSVTGGGAMHLNDAFGHCEGMHTLYQHHEQACAMAAEAYSRVYNRPALVCVTSGPGGTNAITGVLGAWLDSLPMIVISGQVRFDNTARWARKQNGVALRAMGDQEFEIVNAISCMTKYAEMIEDPKRIRYALEKCIRLSQTGRPGPCWLDIPVDIQGSFIETEELEGYIPEEDVLPAIDKSLVKEILDRIGKSERPVFYTGNGIRIAGAEHLFLKAAELLNIPVVVGWNGPDIIPTAHPLYCGRPGGRGDRPGNLAVQNADLILSVGSRLNIRQVGYNFKAWAREAFVIVNDIDQDELNKPSVHADIRVQQDAGCFLEALIREMEERGISEERPLFAGGRGIAAENAAAIVHEENARKIAAGVQKDNRQYLNWLETCSFYRENYPTVLQEYLKDEDKEANVYALLKVLSEKSREGQITVVGNGSACVAGGQAYTIQKDARFISQDAVASMGYDLPAAIGAAAAVFGPDHKDWEEKGRRNPFWKGVNETYPSYEDHDIILITGDGSLQMNLQELQTIVSHQMPIKMIVINNGGYHSIRQTQKGLFSEHTLVGIGEDSGTPGHPDLSFPVLGKLADAYGIPFFEIHFNRELDKVLEEAFAVSGPILIEVNVTRDQQFLPKSAAKRLPDGSIVSPPLEDLAPYLPDDEMDKLMLVKRV